MARPHPIPGPALALALALAGCFGNEVTEFPAGVRPLEDNLASPPAAVDGDRYPERLHFEHGEHKGLYWTHARGYIKAEVGEVWAAMQDPEVVADRRKVDRFSFELGVDPAVHHSFVVHNTVNDLITVDFDVTWRQSAVAGTRAAPQMVAMRFQKTWGSEVISVLRGSVQLTAVDEGVTEVALIEHLEALQGGNDTLEDYLGDLFESSRARVHGEPLPAYEE